MYPGVTVIKHVCDLCFHNALFLHGNATDPLMDVRLYSYR